MSKYTPPLSEKQIGEQIVSYCKTVHIPIFRNNVGITRFANKDGKERFVRFGEPGMPDYSIIIFYKGLPLVGYLETKTATGKQSENQEHFQQWCRENNICYILARSIEDVQEGISSYKNHQK